MVQVKIRTILVGLVALLSLPLHAEVLFEGYALIRSGSVHIGYIVQRFEFDATKKQFTSIYYLKTSSLGANTTESLKAYANDKFQPISYQYTGQVGAVSKTIDAKFTGEKATYIVGDGKNSRTLTRTVKKGVFLSTFLGYLMLQSGYKANKKFVFDAIAEEDGETYNGEAIIHGEEEYKKEKVFRIENKFKGVSFVSMATAKGEILATTSAAQNLGTELVATPSEATKGFAVPNDTLKLLFGNIPTGKQNVLASRINKPATLPVTITKPVTQKKTMKKDKKEPTPTGP